MKWISRIIIFDIMLIIIIVLLISRQKALAPDVVTVPVPVIPVGEEYMDTDEMGIAIPGKISPFQMVTLFGILLEDNGVNGLMIGCNDSLVPLLSYESELFREGEATESGLINEALTTLLEIENSELGEGGLHTVAYQPKLRVSNVEVHGEVAHVFFEGTIELGGACDTPRLGAQIEQTVLQFEDIEMARFYLNESEDEFLNIFKEE